MRKRARGYLLDREEFPFTEQEVFAAARLVADIRAARHLAKYCAEAAPEYVQDRARRRARWRRKGIAHSGPLEGLGVPLEVLAALPLVSESAAQRMERLKQWQWSHRRQGLIKIERQRAAQGKLRRRRAAPRTSPGVWTMYKIDRLPKATPAMIATAERKLAKEIREWRRMCRRVREEVRNRARPNARVKLTALTSGTITSVNIPVWRRSLRASR